MHYRIVRKWATLIYLIRSIFGGNQDKENFINTQDIMKPNLDNFLKYYVNYKKIKADDNSIRLMIA